MGRGVYQPMDMIFPNTLHGIWGVVFLCTIWGRDIKASFLMAWLIPLALVYLIMLPASRQCKSKNMTDFCSSPPSCLHSDVNPAFTPALIVS